MPSRAFLLGLCLTASLRGDLAEGLRFFDIRNGAPLAIGPVDRDSVEGFELLYATPGTGDLAEIAGHLLLRIKLMTDPNSPPGTVPNDLVLSFLADTGEPPPPAVAKVLPECRRGNWLNLVLAPGGSEVPPLHSLWQSIRGLGGGFEVATDLQTLAYTLKSYTVDQDRDLLRYELVLSDAMRGRLIDHLIHLRSQPRPSYYFFHQNCASVLVRVIGEGVGERPTAEFGPWVSPPHSLVALLVRRGLVRPVGPAFLGFRNRGHLYRERYRQTYAELTSASPASPALPWPDFGRFVDRRETRRAEALRALAELLPLAPWLAPEIYALASLAQEMEMVFDPKDRLCRDYTSRATSEARLLQQTILETGGPIGSMPDVTPPPPARGSAHTGLYAFAPGFVLRRVSGESTRASVHLDGALLAQDMGSRSALAMQRAGFLELGGYEFSGGDAFRVTGLQLRKFRENLGTVPSVFANPRGWGLGLGLLEFERRAIGSERSARLAGIATLANLASAPGHRHYAFLGAGVDIGILRDEGQSDWGPAFPLQAETLLGFGTVQWRNRLVWTQRHLQGGGEEWQVGSGLETPLGEWRGSELILRLQAEWREADAQTERRATLGLHVLRF